MNTSTFSLDTYYRRVVSTGPDSAGAIQLLFLTGSATPKISVRSNAQLINGTIDAATGAWVHVAVARSGSSLKLFVDGVQSGSTATTSTNFANGATNGVTIGRYATVASGHFKGFLSNIRVLKGTALYTANFTPPTRELTNVTNTKLLCCQSNTSAIAAAVSPGTITANGDAAATNFNPFNTDINTVRGQETGYATLSPLDSGHSGASITFSDGNLKAAFPSTSGTGQAPATIYVSSGKWYCEYYLESVSDLTSVQYGIVSSGSKRASYIGKSDTTDQYGWEPEIDRAYNNGTNTTPTGKTFTSQWSVAAMALDLDNGTWEMFIDGVPTGTIYSGISGTYTFAIGDTMGSGYHTHTANFGQKPFKFPPPDGFQPLNAANVRPVKVITRPDQYVGVSTWTGNNGIQSINAGLKPDFVWIKGRSNARDHVLFDTIRGPLKTLTTNGTAAEATQADTLTAFNSDGFTIGSQSRTGINNETYVGWSWKAGGSKNTFNVDDVGYASAAAAGLDAGTVNPNKVSVGTKNGFSIIELTTPSSGTTYSFAHGLGAKPSFLIARQYETTGSYYVWHQSLSANNSYLLLNATNAVNTGSTVWASTDMTSTVISDTASGHWGTSEKMLYYAWADVPGLQKFGKYTGNQDADGPFIELGFRPKLIICKGIDDAEDWYIRDTTRSPYNEVNKSLRPNDNGAEYSGREIDILSNGFKLRTADTQVNQSTKSYLYAAWAEAPTFSLYGAQSNAR